MCTATSSVNVALAADLLMIEAEGGALKQGAGMSFLLESPHVFCSSTIIFIGPSYSVTLRYLNSTDAIDLDIPCHSQQYQGRVRAPFAGQVMMQLYPPPGQFKFDTLEI